MKDLARELARLLATPEGLRTARLLQMENLVGKTTPPDPPRPIRRGPEPISIWQPREIDGERVFVRPDPLPLGDHYAATKVLVPKKAELPLRVCFFGESVAAGYLYAPHLTPARVLEAQLRAVGGENNFEVVDLARTNERLPTLVETVQASLQINPDVLVLFVGNNWNLLETPEVSPYAPSVEARQRYALALRDERIQGPLRFAQERLRRSAEEALDTIAFLARTVRIPVVLVVPEVNLADWETRQPPVRLPGDGVALWHSLYREAGDRLDRRDFEGAATVAREMLELDGGSCPASWRLLARAWRGLGDLEEARRAARAEIDAASYATLCFLSAPQATTGVQRMLRDIAQRHGFILVDLPEVFASPLPDRRLFLDYCHLTTEGIHLAMTAVAAEVLNLSGMLDEEVGWRGLLPHLPSPEITPEAEATAQLGAALHTAHRLLPVGPKAPILEHWCEAALDTSPGIAETMLDLIAARSAPCPAVLTPAQQRNLSSPYRLTFQHGWRWDHLDADMIEAIVNVLERRGRAVREEVARRLVESHGIREKGTDLAAPFYLWEPLERFFPEVMSFEDIPRRGTLRSPWPEVSFCLVCDGTRDVDLEPIVRLPSPGKVRVAVNWRDGGVFEAGAGWTRTAFRIGRSLLRPGLNRLTLRWPAPPSTGEEPLRSVLERLELGIAADLHPVFGEVSSLIAKPGS
ncbi:MAG TPA: hypothetical protein VE685_26285 [Thermoanaerobaculia bacterium]|nr:hypothetical protein [Thermoanaerobaculia bacterium]